MTTHQFTLRPIAVADANELRREGGEVYVADDDGYPCRQCLQDASIGDELLLVSHDPFRADSPYRSASPVFVHREDCSAGLNTAVLSPRTHAGASLPTQLTRRQLSVRSFDDSAMMLDGQIIDGTDLAHTIDAMFDDSNATTIHVHNAGRGCWAVAVERAEAAD